MRHQYDGFSRSDIAGGVSRRDDDSICSTILIGAFSGCHQFDSLIEGRNYRLYQAVFIFNLEVKCDIPGGIACGATHDNIPQFIVRRPKN